MSGPPKTAIVTGASQGIGAGIVMGFVERGFTAEDWLIPGQSRNACLIKFVGGSTPDRSKLFEVVIRWLSLLSPIVHATLALARSQSSRRRALDRPITCAFRSDKTEAVSAKRQACPHLAVHVHPDRTLEMGATKMGAAIGCPLVGDSTRGTETAEPLTSTPASWAARLGALNERSIP
jgi:hypothetical protein